VPTYQYACTECGHDFETVQSFTDPALTDCPQCSGRLRKVFNSVGIVFKGSGFYRTDSRETAKGDKGSDPGDKPAEKADKGSDKSSTESKGSTSPDPKTTNKPAAPSKAPAPSGSSTAGSAA
jgi:putative FmdB family regulatory protein